MDHIAEDADDEVLCEMPVILCETNTSEESIYLIQSILRPGSRPYSDDMQCKEMCCRPLQHMLKMDMELDKNLVSYDKSTQDHLRLDSIELKSSVVPLTSGGYAVAIPSDGRLYLLPINVVLQLRPSLKHIDDAIESMRAEAQLNEQDLEDIGRDDGELQAVQVQVKRRETERQMEYRLASYAHIKEEREKEPWQKLRHCDKKSVEAAAYFSRLFATPTIQQLPMRVQEKYETAADYLSAITPGRGIATASAAAQAMVTAASSGMLSMHYLESIPEDQRMKVLFGQGRASVLSYKRIASVMPKGMKPIDIITYALKVSHLVHGHFVARSSVRQGPHSIGDFRVKAARDLALYFFSKESTLNSESMKPFDIPRDILKEAVKEFAVLKRGKTSDTAEYEFKKIRDESFYQLYPDEANYGMKIWSWDEFSIKEKAREYFVSDHSKSLSMLSNQEYQSSEEPKGNVLDAQAVSALNRLLLAKGIITVQEACNATGYENSADLLQEIQARKDLDFFQLGKASDSMICAVEGSAAKRVLAQVLAKKWEPETGLQGIRVQKSEVLDALAVAGLSGSYSSDNIRALQTLMKEFCSVTANGNQWKLKHTGS